MFDECLLRRSFQLSMHSNSAVQDPKSLRGIFATNPDGGICAEWTGLLITC
jgi:hypothetical protein